MFPSWPRDRAVNYDATVIHSAATDGFSRGVDAYRNARPSYHPDVVARLVERYCDGTVLDVGAGTGILTRELGRVGADVVAIEPVEAMRRALVEDFPGVRTLAGTAEDLPVADQSAVTIVAAQAAHWFRYPECLDEFARVLRPAGHLVTVWNVRDESVPWVREYTEALAEFEGDTPRHRTLVWRRAIDGDARFVFAEEFSVANPQATTPDGVVERALSTSFIAALGSSDRTRLASRLRKIVARLGPTFDYPYRSELQAWRVVS